MFSRLATAVAFLAVVAGALGQALTINTPPSVVTCQPVQLTWTGGQGPYFLSILPGNQPGAAALVDFGRQEGNSLTWNTNMAAGTSIFLQVRDSNGAVGQSGTITIQASSDTACVGQSASTSAGPAPTGSTTSAAGGSTTAPAGTTSPAAGGSTTRSTTSTGTATRSAPASTSSGAGNGAVKVGSAGALALAGVAAVAALL